MRITSLIAAALIAAGLWYWFVGRHGGLDEATPVAPAEQTAPATESGSGPEAPEPAPDAAYAPVSVIVLSSAARPAESTLILRGRTVAARSVEVAAETSGKVISDALPAGTTVAEGQVLCRLNPGIRAAELAEAEAALAEAAAEAEASQALLRRGYTPETTAKARQAALRAAQARLDRVRLDIAQLEIAAPFDGVLESDTAETGTLMVPGSICATVIDLATVKVSGYIAEQDVDKLTLGQTATAQLINGVTAEGEITFLSRMADPETRTFAVEVTLANPDGRLRDGMTAELAIALPPVTAHLVPQSALTLDDDGRLGVRTAEAGVARFVPVEILRDAKDGVWITGLPATAEIIVIGQEFVRDGRRIRAVSMADAAAMGAIDPGLVDRAEDGAARRDARATEDGPAAPAARAAHSEGLGQ